MTQIIDPYPQFKDDDGSPLDNGQIYVGVSSLNPRANPVQVYYDEARTVTALQPIRTLGGRPAYQGAPTRLYIAEVEYSIEVLNRFGTPVTGPTSGAVMTASDISFTALQTGAVARTVAAKLREAVSVKDFGAVGDGVADDTAEIQAALSSGAVSVFFPDGRYRVTANLTRSGNTYLYGETMTASILQMEGTASLVYTGGDAGDEYDTKQLQIERLSFECPTVAVKSVIDATWTGGSGGTSKTFIMRDCEITGTAAAGGFANGLALTNARNVVIDSVRVLGDRDASPIASGSGILINGANDPVEIYINKYQAYFCTNGIEIAGTVEGVYISSSTIVACNNGIVGTPTGNQPLLSVIGSHFNTDVAGIRTVGFIQCIINGNLIYGQAGVETAVSYVGVDMSNTTVPMETVINGNVFQNLTTGIPANAIALQSSAGGTTECIVSDNVLRLFDTGVVLGSGTSGAVVQDNVYIACTNDIIDNGAGNFIGRFGQFTRTATSGLAQVLIENRSAANNTTKAAGFGMLGRDTVSGVKDVGAVRSLPQDANWVNATAVIYGRNTDALVGYAFFGINGTPEGVITAPVGAIATRRDGGAATTLYVKQTGTGNTGWAAVTP